MRWMTWWEKSGRPYLRWHVAGVEVQRLEMHRVRRQRYQLQRLRSVRVVHRDAGSSNHSMFVAGSGELVHLRLGGVTVWYE